MNKKQAIVLWVAVILVAVTGLVPPWYQYTSNAYGAVDTRECTVYSPIFMSPQPDFSKFDLPNPDPQSPDYEIQKRIKDATLKSLRKSIHIGIDVPRLGVEWGTLLVVGLGLFFLLADPKKRELAPKERLSYLERIKRAGGTASDAPALDMALDDEELTEDDAPTASDPKHVFSDDEL